jgi:hypothetical protein
MSAAARTSGRHVRLFLGEIPVLARFLFSIRYVRSAILAVIAPRSALYGASRATSSKA